MLTDVTVKVPPRLAIPGAPPEPDALVGDDGLPADDDDGEDEVDALPPENRPMTVTWCPTCSAKLTPESAISLSSLVSPDARLELELLGDVDDGLLDAPLAEGDVPGGTPSLPRVEAPELPLAPLPNFTFFSTKPPPAALLSLAALDGLGL